MKKKYVLSLDQGTTSCRAIVFDYFGNIISVANKEFKQIYPQPGWVEHDPVEIWKTQLEVAQLSLKKAVLTPKDIACIGITNQRETIVFWDKSTGKPLYNAIVWQCRRSSSICERLKKENLEDLFRKKTGLVIDAYFSGTKIKWLFDNYPELKIKALKGELVVGNIDSWLVYNLTGGKVHCTEYSNASRTLLFNIHDGNWDNSILEILGIPEIILPEVRSSSEIYGLTSPELFDGVEIPISGIAGDQQAALFGQGCFFPGTVKNTYGTGCFILMNTGENVPLSNKGLLTTIAWKINNKIEYALEGSIFIAGAVIQWLRDGLGVIKEASESEILAQSVPDTGGVYIVPAFVGLGAPYWDMNARGTIVGLTRGTTKAHITRAAIESIAYQTKDIINCMKEDSNITLEVLRVDGGATSNNFLMQFQADILNLPVERPKILETTALGAAYLAGLAVGYWENKEQIINNWQLDRKFSPSMKQEVIDKLYYGWQRALNKTKTDT